MAGSGRGPTVDRSLVRLFDQLPRSTFEGRLYRRLAAGYGPLSGEGARIHGGRWNPADSFAVLYTAPDPATCLAELTHAAQSQGLRPADLLPRALVAYDVHLERVLDLLDAAVLAALGVRPAQLRDDDVRRTQAIGAAAQFVGFEAIRAESAARPGALALPIFLTGRLADSSVEPVTVETLEAAQLEPEELREQAA